MSHLDDYMAELSGALKTRGRMRRRTLAECREHLVDLASELGEDVAVERFGRARGIARELDVEIAARGASRVTFLTAAGVLGVGASTLALIHAATPGVNGAWPWAVAFFICAQLSATSAAAAALQAATLRRTVATEGDLTLLARRNACALVAAVMTMVAAGGAVPGRGTALLLLAGPVVALAAGVGVVRSLVRARRLRGDTAVGARPPLRDLAHLLRLPVPAVGDWALCTAVAVIAAVGAYGWDLGEGANPASASVAAAIEATAVAACFLAFGRVLGLRAPRTNAGPRVHA